MKDKRKQQTGNFPSFLVSKLDGADVCGKEEHVYANKKLISR